MSLSLLITAGLLAAPLPIPARQAGYMDYPTGYLRSKRSAAALIEIIVTPDGTVAQCREIRIFGDAQFAHELCAFQKPRGWQAAVDGRGQPAYGLVRVIFRMFIPKTQQGDAIASLTQLPDLELTVNRLPVASADHLDVDVSLEVDSSGAVINCEPRSVQEVPDNFSAAACIQAKQLKFDIVLLGDAPLPGFVIEQKVRFVKENATAATPY